MSQDDPLFSYTMAFHALYTEHIPDSYPGEVDWVRGLFDKDSIEQYWVDEPAMLRMWKVAFFKALKWVQELEKAGIVSDYLLLSVGSYKVKMLGNTQPVQSTTFPSVRS